MQGRLLKNRYRLLSELGRGGMGSVWRAEDTSLRIDVAVKLIDPTYANSPEALLRFEREALAAAKLRSVHIVFITEFGVDNYTPYIVMELLEGESLASRLRKAGRLNFDEIRALFTQIGDALAVAHERGIVHRDLKPDNVFIVRERNRERAKVLDFGVPKRLDARTFGNELKTHTGTLLSSPFYRSPEQTRANPIIDHRTDIWSFGIMAYECVTGRRPFDADTLPDLLMAICRDPMPAPSSIVPVPVGFDEWFAATAARDVSKRFSTIDAAVNALQAIQTQRVTTCAPAVTTLQRAASVADNVATGTALSCAAEATQSVAPNSVTAPGLRKPGTPKFLYSWLAAVVVAGVALLLFLWMRSTAATVDQAPAAVSADAAVAAAEPPRVETTDAVAAPVPSRPNPVAGTPRRFSAGF